MLKFRIRYKNWILDFAVWTFRHLGNLIEDYAEVNPTVFLEKTPTLEIFLSLGSLQTVAILLTQWTHRIGTTIAWTQKCCTLGCFKPQHSTR